MPNSGLFRLQEHTPSAYTDDSRDFQLMLRVYDCVNNGVKYYIDSIIDSLNTDLCNSELLGLLKSKIGFFSNIEFTDRELRFILESFPYITKYKGSREGIERAVCSFMRAKGIDASHEVIINNGYVEGRPDHTIDIAIESAVIDTRMLEEVLKYIIPTGYILSISFISPEYVESGYMPEDFGMTLTMKDKYNSLVRGSTQPNATDGVYYGFIQVSSPISSDLEEGIFKYGFEISGESVSINSEGSLENAVFTASSASPQLYDGDNYYVVDDGQWKSVDSEDSSRSCIYISDASVSTSTVSATVLGGNQDICLYAKNGSSVSSVWTNMGYSILGNVGFADVIGNSNDDDSGTDAGVIASIVSSVE